jgi:hypothetical protein
MRSIAFVVCTLIFVELGGCTLVPERATDLTQVEVLLAYYHRLGSQSPDVQRREFVEATAAYEKAPDDATRSRLVLTLMIPGASWRDDARVSQLLSAMEVAPSEQPSARRDFVYLLERMVHLRREEQRKCEQKAEALRDEKRKVEALQQKLDGSREECRKAEVLQQKLDELRDIDRDARKRSSRRGTP